MGRVVHLDRVREFIARTPAFRAKDIELIVQERQYNWVLLHNLVKSGSVKRITKGWYSTRDDPIVSVFAFRPAYLGLQEALSLRNLWEQETNVVLVTPLMVRPGMRRVMGSNVIIHRIKVGHFFGFEYLKYGDMAIPVSDAEKTLIDLVYFNESPGRDVLKKIARNVDAEKLEDYLKRYPEGLRRRVSALTGPETLLKIPRSR
jgi:predicted transcriptional regulator of viral defense system